MIKLSNGAIIHQFGEPNLFLIAGTHGDEIAPIIVLKRFAELEVTEKEIKNVWVLPCLNIYGYMKKSRFYNKIELNRQYIPDTKLDFMLELQNIIKEAKPKIFVDMHEGVGADLNNPKENAFIFSKFQNRNEKLEKKVFQFCKNNSINLLYHALTDNEYSIGCSDTFAVQNGAENAYTTESFQLATLDERLETNRMFLDFFLKASRRE